MRRCGQVGNGKANKKLIFLFEKSRNLPESIVFPDTPNKFSEKRVGWNFQQVHPLDMSDSKKILDMKTVKVSRQSCGTNVVSVKNWDI